MPVQVAHDVVREFAADGVVYLELRSTPRANKESGTVMDPTPASF
jgi:hypothetical protein